MSEDEPILVRYQRELGGFVHDFTWMEVALFQLLCARANIIEPIGKALFNGVRADALVGHIRRCYEAFDEDIPEQLDAALVQARILNSGRNEVVHRVALPHEDGLTVVTSNSLRMPENKAVSISVTPDLLADMAKDCRLILAVLVAAEAQIRVPGSVEYLQSEQPIAWQYIPSRPVPRPHKGRSRARDLEHP